MGLLPVARADEMRHIELNERGTFGSVQRPDRIRAAIPVRQPGDEIRLRGPGCAIVHVPVIFETLQQHGIEPGGTDNPAHGQARKSGEQIFPAFISELPQQEACVILKAGHKFLDKIAKRGAVVIDMGQVCGHGGGLRRFSRPHAIGVDVVPAVLGS